VTRGWAISKRAGIAGIRDARKLRKLLFGSRSGPHNERPSRSAAITNRKLFRCLLPLFRAAEGPQGSSANLVENLPPRSSTPFDPRAPFPSPLPHLTLVYTRRRHEPGERWLALNFISVRAGVLKFTLLKTPATTRGTVGRRSVFPRHRNKRGGKRGKEGRPRVTTRTGKPARERDGHRFLAVPRRDYVRRIRSPRN